jgi:hypothetical protein
MTISWYGSERIQEFRGFQTMMSRRTHVFFGVLNFKLVGGDWNHGMDFDFPFSNGKSSQLTNSLHHFSG